MTLARRVAVLIAAGLALCAAGPTVTYHGTGTVLALLPPPSDLHATRPVIVIEHDPIAVHRGVDHALRRAACR